MGRLRQARFARIGAVIGGMTCVAITPWFALSYFGAYGASSGERPPPWADWIDWPSLISGSNAIDTYNRYGIVYGLSLALVVVSLYLVFASARLSSNVRRSVNIVLAGLGSAAFGSVLEYGFGKYLDAGFGFFAELLGFFTVIVATALLGVGMWRAGGSRLVAAVAASSGLVAIIVGTGLVGHLPSGPGLVPAIAAVAIGLFDLQSMGATSYG